jgi:hypothetical protein
MFLEKKTAKRPPLDENKQKFLEHRHQIGKW